MKIMIRMLECFIPYVLLLLLITIFKNVVAWNSTVLSVSGSTGSGTNGSSSAKCSSDVASALSS